MDGFSGREGALPNRARLNYLFARAMVGREFMFPAVVDA